MCETTFMAKVVGKFSILSVVSGQKLDLVRIYQNYWEKLKKTVSIYSTPVFD